MQIKLGSLSYEARGNLSLCAGINYSPNIGIIKENWLAREVIPREICPFCPLIIGWKSRNFLTYREIRMSIIKEVDIRTSGTVFKRGIPSQCHYLLE